MSPPDGSVLRNPLIMLVWSRVEDPSGITYAVEIEYFAGGGEGYQPLQAVDGLPKPYYEHTVGDVRERWRVWAVDGAGNVSAKTPWWTMTPPGSGKGSAAVP